MSVTAAKGFRAAGIGAGIKTGGGKDLALVVNDGPLDTAAAVFTGNRVKAAPVLWSMQAVADARARAVVLNSGGANACTGPAGFADAHQMAESTASALGVSASDVLVCSTGLIGDRLPIDAVLAGIAQAATVLDDAEGGWNAADAIRTTDSVAKTARFTHADGWTVGGMAKGAGMLAPGLATMLCVLTTDVRVLHLDSLLRTAVGTTFDRIDSDGCMSTNDTVILLASGMTGIEPDQAVLAEAVRVVCADLAGQLLADAEGATKEVEIVVAQAATEAEAVDVARAIARNNLLKCALFGNDPNWGRVLAAIGTTTATFEPDEIDVAINGVQVCRAGAAGDSRDSVDLTARWIRIDVGLHAGTAAATVYTNDLSHAYVEENSAYSS